MITSSRGRIDAENFLSFLCGNACCGKLSFFHMHKCMNALRILAYGKGTNAIDTEIWMGVTKILNTMVQFARTVVKVFGAECLREPTMEDT